MFTVKTTFSPISAVPSPGSARSLETRRSARKRSTDQVSSLFPGSESFEVVFTTATFTRGLGSETETVWLHTKSHVSPGSSNPLRLVSPEM